VIDRHDERARLVRRHLVAQLAQRDEHRRILRLSHQYLVEAIVVLRCLRAEDLLRGHDRLIGGMVGPPLVERRHLGVHGDRHQVDAVRRREVPVARHRDEVVYGLDGPR